MESSEANCQLSVAGCRSMQPQTHRSGSGNAKLRRIKRRKKELIATEEAGAQT
jgi:hypothetical protein